MNIRLLTLTLPVFLLAGCEPSPRLPEVYANSETEPVLGIDDAADDPAIWVHPSAPDSSLVIGTDKDGARGGLHVFDLTGKRVFFAEDSRVNNVDLRDGFDFGGGETGPLVAASRRSDSSLAVYKLNPSTRVLEKREARTIRLNMEPYGLCLYRTPDGEIFVFVGDKDGRFVQMALRANDSGLVDASPVRTLKLSSQAEGCVADDETGWLYVAEEDIGLWRFAAAPDADPTPQSVDSVRGHKFLKDDMEGVALYNRPDGSGYLIVSSQGNNSFALYDRQPPNHYVGSFRVGAGKTIDGVSETDGLEATSLPMGPRYPKGALVVQDGDNRPDAQNFKIVDWREIEKVLELTP